MELFEEGRAIQTKKDYINYERLSKPKTGVLFTDFIKDIVSKRSKRMSNSYPKNYETLIYNLKEFSKNFKAELYTNSINEEFLDDFIYFLEQKDCRRSYVKYMLQLVKAMVRKAANYGYVVDMTYDNIDVANEDIPSVYLSMNEITRIYYFKGLTNKQEKIKDLFIIGCLTALRYSDLVSLNKEEYDGKFITKVTKKTNTKVIIPVHDYVKEIFEKYNEELPNKLTSQHFNRYIKLICKKVGLTDKVVTHYSKGANSITETKEKWQLISTHTARRSGATNLYNTGRIPIRQIMSITGHTTEKSFMRYIKTSKEDIANNMLGDLYYKK